MTPTTTSDLPRGARTALRQATRAHAGMRRYSVRGGIGPGPEYKEHRRRFLEALVALQRLRVPQQVLADELGITRQAVHQWLKQVA